MKKYLKAQNLAGYNNNQSNVSTIGSATKGITAKQAHYDGALGSSKANINVARFDTVPVIRGQESYYWFGIRDGGER